MTHSKDESTDPPVTESQSPPSAETGSTETAGQESPRVQTDVSPQKTSTSQRDGRTRRTLFIIIAVIIILAALGGAGYYGWLKLIEPRSAARAQQLATLQNTIQDQSNQIQRLQNQISELSSDNESLQRDLRRGLGNIDELTRRLSEAERSMSALRGISESSRNTLLLAEARYFLQLAANRLRLERDTVSAGAALEAASQRLAATGDPAYNPVLAIIQEESRSLDAIEVPDIGSITASLAEISSLIDGFPLQGNMPAGSNSETAALDEKSGLDRALAAVGNAFRDMFRVRRIDERVMPLITPNQEYFLRQNVILRIEAARLAAQRRDTASFERSLGQSITWIDTYFDKNDPQVSDALATLKELSLRELDPELPDISGSLTLLNRIGFPGTNS